MRAIIAGVLGCLTVACGSPGPQAFLDTDKTAIRASIDSFTVYVVQRRDSMAAAMYAENATYMPPNQPMVRGRTAIREWMKAFPAISHFTGSPIEIDGREDLAFVRGTYQLSYVAGGIDHGKFVEVRRRDNNRRWLIIADIFNSDVPVPTRCSVETRGPEISDLGALHSRGGIRTHDPGIMSAVLSPG